MYSFIYLRCPDFGQKWGQSSTATDHRGPIGSLTFDPLDSHTFRLHRYAKLYFFMNHLGDPVYLSPISLKSNQFENLTPVQKVNDL